VRINLFNGKEMRKFLGFFDFVGLHGYGVFFVVIWYFGSVYPGMEDSNYYLCFWVAIFVFALAQSLGIIMLRRTTPRSMLISFVLFTFFTILFFSADMIDSVFFRRFIGMSTPAIFLGSHCAFYQLEKKVMYYFEHLLVLSLLPFAFSLSAFLKATDRARFVLESGGNAMNAGYLAAVFLIYLIIIYFQDQEIKKRSYSFIEKIVRNKILLFFAIVFFFLIVFSAGSRGPLVAIFVLPLCLVLFQRKYFRINTLKAILCLFFLVIGGLYLLKYNQIQALDHSLMRANLLVEGVGSADIGSASIARISLYHQAIDLFNKNPAFGSGFLSFIKRNGRYTHNLFLDLLTDFGIFGFFIVISFILYIFISIFKRIKVNADILPFFSILAVEIVKLMFSSTYSSSYVLWFFVGYGISCRFDHRKRIDAKMFD
jgi:O-antigen ligase